MKIAIDISQIVYRGSGVARYTDALVHSLLKYDQVNKYVFFFSGLRQKLDKNLETKIRQHHTLKKLPFPPTALEFLWNKLHIFPIENMTGKLDLVLTSDWTEPPSNFKKLTVVHDLVYLKHPQTLHPKIVSVQKRRLSLIKRESHHIIADSHTTKKDLIDILKIPRKKITVIYPAVEIKTPSTKSVKKTLNKHGLNTSFILTVGKIEPRKNLSRLIKAFLDLSLEETQLAIVGPEGWGEMKAKLPITDSIAGLGGTNKYQKIKFLGYVSDTELYSLYKSALFFVYPSLYEGFGYPVAEAMTLGCPVTTSNTSSLRELGEDTSLLFNPTSLEEIKQSLKRMRQDKSLRKNLAQKGRKKSNLFKSKAFAQQIIKVFKKTHDNRY